MPKTFIKYLIRSNIFVAICAASLAWQSILVVGQPINEIYEVLTVFLGTWFVYNMHRYVKKGTDHTGKWQIDSHVIYMLISAVFLMPILFFIEQSALFLFIICAFITVTYSINVVRIKGKWRNLRQGFLKPISVVMMWSILTVVFPLSNQSVLSSEILLLLLERFLFLMAITLPFDLRDMSIDEKEGVRTIPLIIGWRKTINMSIMFIVLFAITAFVTYILKMQNIYVLLAYLGSALITFFAVHKTKPERNVLHYAFTLEAMSLIQTLLISGLLLSGLS